MNVEASGRLRVNGRVAAQYLDGPGVGGETRVSVEFILLIGDKDDIACPSSQDSQCSIPESLHT